MHEDAPVNGGARVSLSERIHWKKQPLVTRAGQWNVLSWRKGEKISKCQSKKVDFTSRPKSSLFVSSWPSSLPRSVWSVPFELRPSPSPVFLSWYRNLWGVSSKTRLNSYLQTVIRSRTWDECVYTAFTDYQYIINNMIYNWIICFTHKVNIDYI